MILQTPTMTLSLRISKSKTLYLFAAFFAALAATTVAAQREVLSDTEVYYFFYRSLIDNGITSIFSCQAFEPLFCGGSYVFASLTGSQAAVHFLWAFVFYITMLRAFLALWPVLIPESRYTLISFATFLFVSLNYVDPEAIYFLTRQYVAASLLMLGVVRIVHKRSPLISFALAFLIHFGSLPIAVVLYLATRERIGWKLFVAAAAALGVYFYYLSDLIAINVYLDSVRARVEIYANRNDGNVTIVQEIRLLLYWTAAIYMFRIAQSRLALAYVIVYVAYLFSFQNDLYHLRYHKYLEVMAWPSAFILFFVKKEASGHLVVGALAYRIYKYASLFSPEVAAPSMARTLLVSFLILVSWLSF